MGEGLKTFDGMKMMFKIRSVSLNTKKELYERMIVPAVMYGAKKKRYVSMERPGWIDGRVR